MGWKADTEYAEELAKQHNGRVSEDGSHVTFSLPRHRNPCEHCREWHWADEECQCQQKAMLVTERGTDD